MKPITKIFNFSLWTVGGLFLLAASFKSYGQDSIRVKILKIKKAEVVMKTLDRPRVKFITKCNCPYKRKEIVYIKKP